jgi:hypothetical protein
MAQILTLEDKTLVHVYPKTASENPGSVIPGTYIWSADGDAIVTLNVLADGSLCEVIATSEGTCAVVCTAENVPGNRIGFRTPLEFEVIAPLAAFLDWVADAPVPK